MTYTSSTNWNDNPTYAAPGYEPAKPASRKVVWFLAAIALLVAVLAYASQQTSLISGTGGTGAGAGSWTAPFSDFSALIGAGPSAVAFDGQHCKEQASPSGSVIASVTCSGGPSGVRIVLEHFASAADVPDLGTQASASGASAQQWSHDYGPDLGYFVEKSTASGSEIITTFDDHPTMLLDMTSTGPLTGLSSLWYSAPLPD